MLSASGMKPAELKQVVSGQQLTSKKNVLDEGENVTRSWFDESGLLLIAFSFLLLPEHFCGDALMWISRQGKSHLFCHKASLRASRACEHDAATRAAITSFLVLPPPSSAAAVLRLTVQRLVTHLLTSSAVSPTLVDSQCGRLGSSWLLLDGALRILTIPVTDLQLSRFFNMSVENGHRAQNSDRKPFVTSQKKHFFFFSNIWTNLNGRLYTQG